MLLIFAILLSLYLIMGLGLGISLIITAYDPTCSKWQNCKVIMVVTVAWLPLVLWPDEIERLMDWALD
jgi:hypothetical protein